jgi:glutamate-1-semialdehyde 2,1-aminomutase
VDFTQSRRLQPRFHALIPGGSHTYAKGDDQYPEFMPAYIVRGKGCHVWDADGNEFIEYGCGGRAVTLGHAYAPVIEAAARQMHSGANFSRPTTLELECAEALLGIVDGAEMVKFGKNGSDATNGAIRLARAYTGRDMVAICQNHPFFSVDDWFIGSTPMNAGIPKVVQDLTVKFAYNDVGSLAALFDQYPNRIAGVILEAEKEQEPVNRFLHEALRVTHEHGAVFILDEMITGFRWHLQGAQKFHDIVPDLSTFGKAIGNGFALSALLGKRELMRLGGLDHDKERVFLISTTHGAEGHALAAGMETMRIYRSEPVIATLWERGERLARGINAAARDHRLEEHVPILGRPCCLVFGSRDADGKPSQPLRTLLMQELMKRGVLASSLVVSYSHTEADIDRTVEAFHGAMGVYRKALDEGTDKYLEGRPVKPVMRKFN